MRILFLPIIGIWTCTSVTFSILTMQVKSVKRVANATARYLLPKSHGYLKTYLKCNLSCRNNSQNVVHLCISRLTLGTKDKILAKMEEIWKLFKQMLSTEVVSKIMSSSMECYVTSQYLMTFLRHYIPSKFCQLLRKKPTNAYQIFWYYGRNRYTLNSVKLPPLMRHICKTESFDKLVTFDSNKHYQTHQLVCLQLSR